MAQAIHLKFSVKIQGVLIPEGTTVTIVRTNGNLREVSSVDDPHMKPIKGVTPSEHAMLEEAGKDQHQ
jgi:hypothetical protein